MQRLLWTMVRCRHCGIPKTKRVVTAQIYPSQMIWLSEVADLYKIQSRNKALRIAMDYCIMENIEQTIFAQFKTVVAMSSEATSSTDPVNGAYLTFERVSAFPESYAILPS